MRGTPESRARRRARRQGGTAWLVESMARIERILELGVWPAGLDVTPRERELLELNLADARDRLAHRGIWAP